MSNVSTTPTGDTEYTTTQKAAGQANGSATCSRIEIEPTQNGGFSVKSFFKQSNDAKGSVSNYREPDGYAFSTFAELTAFLGKELGGDGADRSVSTETGDSGADGQ